MSLHDKPSESICWEKPELPKINNSVMCTVLGSLHFHFFWRVLAHTGRSSTSEVYSASLLLLSSILLSGNMRKKSSAGQMDSNTGPPLPLLIELHTTS